MRESLIVIGLVVLAVALRSSRSKFVRKLGAVTFLAASFCLFYFVSACVAIGLAGMALWLFLPWIELLTRIRRLRLPLNNRLIQRPIPNPEFFPQAPEAATAMEDSGFEHVSDCGWEWQDMRQHFRLYWHPEERAIAAICLCEQSDVGFAFLSITSFDDTGRIWRSTNFPFAPTLLCPPDVRWNHVHCARNCFHYVLRQHRKYLKHSGIPISHLRIPDPEDLKESIESEMRRQITHNLAAGIIRPTGDGYFRYSKRGLIFLWGQFIKDMVRFC